MRFHQAAGREGLQASKKGCPDPKKETAQPKSKVSPLGQARESGPQQVLAHSQAVGAHRVWC